MILDNIRNIRYYQQLLPKLENGLQAVENLPAKAEARKHEFDGGFFFIQTGVTKPMIEGDFEAHRKYIDVQIVLEGSEEVAWADIQELQEKGAYEESVDKAMYTGKESTSIKMSAGMCYIAFPQDAHKAVRHTEVCQSYKKIIMKLLIEE